MKPWNIAPTAADEPRMREVLPMITPATRARLVEWAWRWTNARGWLLHRASDYWTQFHKADTEPQLLDATAALDLLRWQTGANDRAAVEQLNTWRDIPPSPDSGSHILQSRIHPQPSGSATAPVAVRELLIP